MQKTRKLFLALLGVLALAVPTAAVAHSGKGKGPGAGQEQTSTTEDAPGKSKGKSKSKGKAKGKSKAKKPVAYVFKGTYKGDGVVAVTSGNAHTRKAGLVGKDVSFDLSSAKVNVADTNGDGKSDASDVKVGDKVVVQAKLPRKTPGAQPFKARKLVDQTNPKPKDDDDKKPEETPAPAAS